MPERNYVLRGVKISQEAVIDLDDLYKVMYAFFDRHGYDWLEKDYKEKKSGKNRVLEIVWWVERKVDDYTKFIMELTMGVDGKEIKVKKGRRYDGKISLKLYAYLENDYENAWTKSGVSRFVREVYDKFIIRGHFSRLEGELKDESDSFLNEVKAFLRMHKRPEGKK